MDSRFDADKVIGLAVVTAQRRFEMQFSDSDGRTHVVSLPLPVAAEFGCLICDVCEATPFFGDMRRTRRQKAK